MISVLFGLFAALLIGTSDALARVTGRRLPILAVTTVLFLLGLAPLSVYMTVADLWPTWRSDAVWIAVLSGAFNAIGLGLLFAALARGPVAIASPAASSFSIFLIILNVLDGQPFLLGHGVAVALMTLGVVLLARSPPPGSKKAHIGGDARALVVTALLAVAAAFFIALRMFTAQEIEADLGAAGVTFATRLAAGLCAAATYLIWRAAGGRFEPRALEPGLRHPPIWVMLGLQSCLEAASLMVFLSGGAMENRIGAVIGFASFAAFAPIAAWMMWREPIGGRRAFCIGLTMFGAIAAAVA